MRPAAQFLSLTRQRKKPKKGDPTSATPLLRSGANLRRGSVGVGRKTHFALFERSVQTAAASQFTKRLHAALQPPPARTAPQAQPQGAGIPESGHRFARPRFARRKAPAPLGAERSDGPDGFPTPVDVPRSAERAVGAGCAACPRFVL